MVLAGVIAAAFAGIVPWLAIVTFTGLMARAIWAAVEARPVPNIKRFGFIKHRPGELGTDFPAAMIRKNRKRSYLGKIFPAKLQRTAAQHLIVLFADAQRKVSHMVIQDAQGAWKKLSFVSIFL